MEEFLAALASIVDVVVAACQAIVELFKAVL